MVDLERKIKQTMRTRRFYRLLCVAALFIGCIVVMANEPGTAEESRLSPDGRQLVEGVARDYLRNNPEILKEVIAALRQKENEGRRQDALRLLSQEIREKPTAAAVGSEQADITIVEFLDYRCSYCRKVEQSIQKLLRTDARLRIIHKQLPILGRTSILAARMDLVAQKLGRHADFHDALMSRTGEIDERAIVEVAQAIKLDPTQVKNLIDSPEIRAALRADIDLAKKLALTATPGFVIGDEVIQGAPEMAELADLIAQERILRPQRF